MCGIVRCPSGCGNVRCPSECGNDRCCLSECGNDSCPRWCGNYRSPRECARECPPPELMDARECPPLFVFGFIVVLCPCSRCLVLVLVFLLVYWRVVGSCTCGLIDAVFCLALLVSCACDDVLVLLLLVLLVSLVSSRSLVLSGSLLPMSLVLSGSMASMFGCRAVAGRWCRWRCRGRFIN